MEGIFQGVREFPSGHPSPEKAQQQAEELFKAGNASILLAWISFTKSLKGLRTQ